jgi:hypothetical protein
MIIKNSLEINKILCDFIEKCEPFSCIRLGNTENYILNNLYSDQLVPEWWFSYFCNVAGVFPIDINFYKNQYIPSNLNAIKNSDIVGWVPITQVDPLEKFEKEVLRDKVCFTDLDFLDPCYLVEYEEPWTSKLAGKKVLVVSPHHDSIFKQWKNKQNVWGNKVDKILPFELVDVIKSPHPPQIEGGSLEVDGKELSSWFQVEKYLENQISKYDFDLLIVGAGAYAPPLCSFAKSMGKMAINPGGATQLFFGIYGKRWTTEGNFPTHVKYFNDDWIYPLTEDKPKNFSVVESMEGNCYW